MVKQIYMDNNATTQLMSAVSRAMIDVMNNPLNPSSPHIFGRKAKSLLENARTKVLEMAGASDKYQLIFTSSGTEANNMALSGFNRRTAITTTVEHASVLKVIGQGLVPVDKDGLVNLEVLDEILQMTEGPKLLSIQYANNETGVIQPIKDIVRIAKQYDVIVHTDATQVFGKTSFCADELGVDMVTLSAHKFGGPVGAAALIFKRTLPLSPLMVGGGQEYRFRPGTQNVVAIHGFGVAAELEPRLREKMSEVVRIRNYIEDELLTFARDAVVFGENSPRLPNTLSISMPGVSSETQVIHFDINNIAISAGSACSSGRVDIPYVQMAMGYDEETSRSAIRVSLSINNTMDEAEEFVRLWKELYKNSKIIGKAA